MSERVRRDGILGHFCSMLFTDPSTGGFSKKTILYSGFNNASKHCETRKLKSIHE
jgi:hypothetical protein